MNKTSLVGLLLISTLTISGCNLFTIPDTDTSNQLTPQNNQETSTQTTNEPSTNPLSETSQEILAEQPSGEAKYLDYTPELQAELDGNQAYGIFFHAPWCPQCQLLESQIESNLKDLPNSITILKADYDSQTDLKAKYDIRIQSTVVAINKDGEVTSTIPYTTNFLQVADALILNLE